MAGNDALLAALLMGQKQRRDPLEIYHSFGRNMVQQGSSTAPLGSGNALEGIARALQGGIGGLMQGWAMGKQADQDKATGEGLQNAALAKTPEEWAAAMKGVRGTEGNAHLGQIASSRLAELLMQRQAGVKLGPLMDPALGSAAPAAPPMQQGGGAAPPSGVPQPGYAASNAPGSITNNNVGNITNGQGGFRQYATPQAGAADVASLLRRYPIEFNNGQPMTLTQIAARYAPADDGKDPMLKGNDPVIWARNVGQIAGIDPNAPLDFDDPAILTKVVNGINVQEKGRGAAQPPQVLNQGVAQAMDPTAFPPGAQPSAQPGSIPPGTVAQPPQGAGPTPTAPQGPPTAMSSPAGDQMRQRAQAAAQAGDNVTALKYAQAAADEDAKWSSEVGKKSIDSAEWDRRQAEEQRLKIANEQRVPANNEQTVAAGFADRMVAANQAIDQFGKQGASKTGRLLEALPFGVGNSVQSPEYQQFEQARRDFINALLRRESGAAIGVDEFKNADRQYFPQPGDSEAVIAQKAQNRALAVEGIKRGAGPAYKPAAIPATPQPETNAAPGAPAAGTMMDGYRFKGGDPAKQENWERVQ